MRMRGVGVAETDSAADVGHVGFEVEQGELVVVAGGAPIAAAEDGFLLVVAAVCGDAVAAHGRFGVMLEVTLTRLWIQAVYSSRFARKGSEDEDAGGKREEEE